MTKHIWCEVCESPKGPLFAVKDSKGKHYICKNCIEKFKAMSKEAEDAANK